MYAHVTAYELASNTEVYADIEHAWHRGEVITDLAAKTIASWWHSPSDGARNLTALSHGLPFDTEGLAEEIAREVTQPDDRDALVAWLANLDDLMQEAS